METQKRAAKGGEEGANGEWYEGGKFIATTEHVKGSSKAVAAKPERKQEYAPFKWDFAPVAGQLAIFRTLNGTARYNRQSDTFEANEAYLANMQSAAQRETYRSSISRYNAGQRWE